MGWPSAVELFSSNRPRRDAAGIGAWLRGPRRSPSRMFRPALDGRLEVRALLSGSHPYLAVSAKLLKQPNAKLALEYNHPPFLRAFTPPFIRNYKVRHFAATQTAHGGQAVEVSAPDGSHYLIKLAYTSNTIATDINEGANGQGGNSSATSATSLVSQQNANYPQAIGTVRAYPMPNHMVGIIVDGSTPNTDLTINPLGQPQKKGFAHSFAYGEAARGHVLNVGQITVTSGSIGAIEGFQDTNLAGPLVVASNSQIDRLAFYSISPGASITTGGDVNTLDVYQGIDLSGTNSFISIGRDLNLLNVGTNIDLTNGATFAIGRNLGLVPQAPKGTGTGSNVLTLNFNTLANTTITVALPPSVGAFIQGNVIVNPGSAFGIGGNIFNTMYVEGQVSAGLTPLSTAPFGAVLTRLTVLNGTPAFKLQTSLGSSQAFGNQGFVTALGGFS